MPEETAGTDRQRVHKQLEAELSILWRKVRRLSIAFVREAGDGLDVAAYTLLAGLSEGGDIRAGDLAERFGMDKSTVSRQIAQMESLNLIQRVTDPVDGRARLIHITDEGRDRIRQMGEARGRWLRSALEPWPAEDVDRLAELLGRLNVSLEHRDRGE